MKEVLASAYANIALIKYWGKRDEFLMLPTKSSLSVSLDALKTTTEITFSDSDQIVINNQAAQGESQLKILRFLHVFRKKFNINKFFQINSVNSFPTAAGLASSASGIAALTRGLNELCSLNLSSKELSILARRGSGSAARSVFGGFVLWHKGSLLDGTDSFAEQIFTAQHWPEFRLIIAIVQQSKKYISSTQAMQTTVKTCKIYNDWVKNSERRIKPMIDAIANKDLQTVGELAQIDCLDMHETMRMSSPSINYWTDKTMKIIDLVNNLRRSGIQCYFTIDAGPNVKILTLEKHQEQILSEIKNIEDVQTIVSGVAVD
jgi:diphosphomevalonate decarboxylase